MSSSTAFSGQFLHSSSSLLASSFCFVVCCLLTSGSCSISSSSLLSCLLSNLHKAWQCSTNGRQAEIKMHHTNPLPSFSEPDLSAIRQQTTISEKQKVYVSQLNASSYLINARQNLDFTLQVGYLLAMISSRHTSTGIRAETSVRMTIS